MYPKLFQATDISCFHPIENIYSVSRRNPNPSLCSWCTKFLEMQVRLYQELSTAKDEGQMKLVI